MFIRDAAAATSHEVTPEGFLRVRARIGRVGVHDYRAAEIGFPAGFAPTDLVRVYRPPEEVFAPDSMESFRHKPVTDNHPPEMVNARNWRLYAIGSSGHEVRRDGDHLAADLLISDETAATRALAGAELSNGYFADFEFRKGETPEGDPYDAIQSNIRGNHVALVDAGRCGDTCRIGDAPVQDCGCEGSPAAELAIDERAELDSLRLRLRDLQEDHRRTLEARDATLADLAAREPDHASLNALAAERLRVLDAARRVFGTGFDPAARSAVEIRRLVVAKVLGHARVQDRDDAYVAAAFDTLLVAPKAVNPLAAHLSTGLRDAAATREAALAARNLHLTDAWKGEHVQGA